ncbi:hypothetical protein PENSPDRAFT_749748 [Peniophora sp. CONT]|nr:hypothetical protein PENSPDRAFT_749748 [Peniophora sp. CONT]
MHNGSTGKSLILSLDEYGLEYDELWRDIEVQRAVSLTTPRLRMDSHESSTIELVYGEMRRKVKAERTGPVAPPSSQIRPQHDIQGADNPGYKEMAHEIEVDKEMLASTPRPRLVSCGVETSTFIGDEKSPTQYPTTPRAHRASPPLPVPNGIPLTPIKVQHPVPRLDAGMQHDFSAKQLENSLAVIEARWKNLRARFDACVGQIPGLEYSGEASAKFVEVCQALDNFKSAVYVYLTHEYESAQKSLDDIVIKANHDHRRLGGLPVQPRRTESQHRLANAPGRSYAH